MNYKKAQNEFIKLIESNCYEFQAWELFTDFCKMTAISLYQPFLRSEELEKEYLQTISKYKKNIAEIFPKLLSYLAMGLEDKMGDFLGECFMNLNLGSKYKGQFFTPYHISNFMASILGEPIKNKESIVEPCCGSGVMIIARADIIKREYGFEYQNIMEVQAIDVDILCVHMSFIQLSLLGISAEVIHGNALSNEKFSIWYTPKYIMNASNRQTQNHNQIKKEEEKKEKQNRATNDLQIEQHPQPKKITLPCDTIENKLLYTNKELEIFATGRLF